MAGKDFNDRTLAAEVRTLTLNKIKEILSEKKPKDKEFYKALILRLAGGVLPRLNEHTGEGGEPIQFLWSDKLSSNTPPGTGPDTFTIPLADG